MPAVRRGVKNHVVRPPFDTAFKYCFKRLVGRVLGVERKIVAKHDETVRGASCKRHQGWETVDVFPVDLDQFEWPRAFSVAQVGIDARVVALTSEDFPMPRAPHSRALLAGRPLANRSVFSTSTSRT